MRVPTDNSVDWTTQYGWYMDLPDSGERVISPAVILGEAVFFNTVVPDSQICGFGGSGWLMGVDLENGGELDEPAFDVNNDGVINNADYLTQSGV
ncbi:MAG: hypothetical protein GWO02_00515, partial [Gammaproteobacteria bacterium]|nr:hypothetical protein [Gammaproteobacteria bacterium]